MPREVKSATHLRILRWVAIGLITTAVLVSALYLWDINRAYERVRGKSTVIPSQHHEEIHPRPHEDIRGSKEPSPISQYPLSNISAHIDALFLVGSVNPFSAS